MDNLEKQFSDLHAGLYETRRELAEEFCFTNHAGYQKQWTYLLGFHDAIGAIERIIREKAFSGEEFNKIINDNLDLDSFEIE